MKKVLLVLTVLALATSVNAQGFLSWGVRGGLSSTSFDPLDYSGTNYSIENLENSTVGFHVGVFTRVKVAMIYIQPELLYSSVNNDIKLTDISTNSTSEITQSFGRIDIPVLVGVKFGPLRVNAGPVGSFYAKVQDGFDAIESEFNNMTFGYQAGIGLDLGKKLTIDLKYEGAVKSDAVTYAGTTMQFDQRPSQVIASLGIFF